MKALMELKERLFPELEDMAKKPKLSVTDLDVLYKVTQTIKNLCKIMMLEEEGGMSQRGYSRDGGSYDGGSYGMSRNSYDSGNSYSRSYSMDGYSQRRNYSRDSGREQMIQKLRGMMHEVDNEQDREAIRKCMTQLENV